MDLSVYASKDPVDVAAAGMGLQPLRVNGDGVVLFVARWMPLPVAIAVLGGLAYSVGLLRTNDIERIIAGFILGFLAGVPLTWWRGIVTSWEAGARDDRRSVASYVQAQLRYSLEPRVVVNLDASIVRWWWDKTRLRTAEVVLLVLSMRVIRLADKHGAMGPARYLRADYPGRLLRTRLLRPVWRAYRWLSVRVCCRSLDALGHLMCNYVRNVPAPDAPARKLREYWKPSVPDRS